MSDRTQQDRRSFLGRAVQSITAARLGMLGTVMQQIACGARSLGVGNELSSLSGATAWCNSPALAPGALRGKVVLVDFCTYTCINWLRTLPFVRAWDARYRDRGLVVIGAHTPEFAFEHDLANVRQAVERLRIDYPIAVDNDYGIWHAFGNNYWPAVYIVDSQGLVRYRHFGEGQYDETEMTLRKLLSEARGDDLGPKVGVVDARGVEAAADVTSLRSQETYVGYARAENFASPGGIASDEPRAYVSPRGLLLGHWALSGEWTIGREATVLNSATGRIVFRFHARDLHLVMGPVLRGTPVRFRVTIDGQAPGSAHGLDVDDAGNGTADEERMYQLIRQERPIIERTFEIEFLAPGAAAYSFTFG